jgi:hypothetical protein
MERSTRPVQDGNADGQAEPWFTAEDFANRTPVDELIAKYTEGGGWRAWMTPERAAAFQEHLDRIIADGQAEQAARS